MKQFGVLCVLLAAASVVTLSAQAKRIFTNPRPEPYFKTMFPNAGGFSPLGGTPLHYKVFAADPKTNPAAPPIGFIFWTTDVAPKEVGYHGPIHFLVGMDTRGVIQSVVMDYNSEPYGYFSVDPPKFVEQFKNKSIRDQFLVGRDIAAVSRATITVSHAARAIRDSARTIAKTFLTPDQIKQ
ncbi:MAG TPA: FMN-binding protein [Vicinamibacterales bacterium]|nr:FMN-binding protein [Vicinamibacterales bacterium]